MKKYAVWLGLLCLLLALPVARAEAAYYWFQVKDENLQPITSGFTCHVITVASQNVDVVFTDNAYGTQKTNPVNPNSQGVCAFATSSSTVDVSVWGTAGKAKGATAKITGAADTDHVIVMNTTLPTKHLRLFWDRSISKGAETDTGVDLPIGAMVDDVWIEVATGSALASISVGLLSTEASGNREGFCTNQGTDHGAAPFQMFRCQASRTRVAAIEGAGGNERYYYHSNTRGVLLASWARGQSTLPVGDYLTRAISSNGQYQEYPLVIQQAGAKSVVYQTRDISNSAGWIHIFYREFRSR